MTDTQQALAGIAQLNRRLDNLDAEITSKFSVERARELKRSNNTFREILADVEQKIRMRQAHALYTRNEHPARLRASCPPFPIMDKFSGRAVYLHNDIFNAHIFLWLQTISIDLVSVSVSR